MEIRDLASCVWRSCLIFVRKVIFRNLIGFTQSRPENAHITDNNTEI